MSAGARFTLPAASFDSLTRRTPELDVSFHLSYEQHTQLPQNCSKLSRQFTLSYGVLSSPPELHYLPADRHSCKATCLSSLHLKQHTIDLRDHDRSLDIEQSETWYWRRHDLLLGRCWD